MYPWLETKDYEYDNTDGMHKPMCIETDTDDFIRFSKQIMKGVFKKFKKKNKQYASDSVLDNVKEQTVRRVGNDYSMDDVLHTIFMLKDKHEMTLLRKGLDAGDVEDRITDCIVYDLMALYLLHEFDET
jgi:hypothetical protein